MGYVAKSQDEGSAAPTTSEINDRLNGVDENVTTLLNDVSGLKKIKLSGYMQIQWEKGQKADAFGLSPYSKSDSLDSRFRVRRSRLKVTYDAGLTQYVLQGDFSNSGFSLKDAYLNITDPWTKYFGLRLGVFNRPNYEVEYSSSTRESMERSRVISTLYPNERDLGAMLTIEPDDMFKLQIAAFNNTFKGPVSQTGPISAEYPMYYMARLTKDFKIMDGLGIDLGVHGRFGSVRSNSYRIIEPEQGLKFKADSVPANLGSELSRSWYGGEMQLYWDFLGGMKLMGEYIMGSDVNETSLSTDSPIKSIRKRDFAGYYVMLVKNVITDWQVAVKYDSYDPNTAIDDAKIDDKSDLVTNTVGFGLHNYTFDNVRISLWYDMIKTQEHSTVLPEDPKDDMFTLRFQYKF
jgi:hypothetical protein